MSDFIVNSQLLRWDNVLEGTGIVFDRLGGLGKNVSISVDTNVIATVASLEAYQQVSSKDAAGGYAGLDASGKLATAQINFDTSTFYIDANGILKLKTDRISNPFTATGLGADGVPTGLSLGEDAATLSEVEVNDTIRFSAAISWSGTDYEAQTVFMRVATTAGTLADFAVQGAPVTSLDQLEQGAVNKYLTAEQLEKLIRMNYSDIAYTGQLDSAADDCDTYKTTGVWNVPNASAIANTPNKGQGGILFCFQRGTYSTSARVQVYLQSAGAANPVIPYVRVYNGTAATWSAWERIIKSTDLATVSANGLMSAADKAKLDNTLTQSDSDARYIINGRTGEKKMCLTSNAEIPAEGALSYIAACGYGAANAICSGLTVARRANGSYAVYLQTFGENSTLEVCSKGAATVLGYSNKTLATNIFGKTISLSGESVLCNGSMVFTIAMVRSSDYLATVSANGLMSAADKAKLDKINPFSGSFDFALAPTQGQLAIVLKNAPAVAPWNVHMRVELHQYSGAPNDRTEPASYFVEGHFTQGDYAVNASGFADAEANGRYEYKGLHLWIHAANPLYRITGAGSVWYLYRGEEILYRALYATEKPYGTINPTPESWVWYPPDTEVFLPGAAVVADIASGTDNIWQSVNYNASSLTNRLEAGFCVMETIRYPAIILKGKFTQGKVVVTRIDYNAAPTNAELALIATAQGAGATIQADAAKRCDPLPGNVEWENLTAQVVQSTNRADGVRRSYCAALTLGALAYSGSFGWSATSCTIEAPTVSLDLQNTPTDFAVDVAVDAAAAGKAFSLALTNGIQGTHCVVSFRNVSTYRIGMTDGNGKTVYLDGGETALARLVSANAANRFEWIAAGAGNGSGGGGTEYVSFTAADVDANGNLVIIAAGEPVAICKTDLSNRIEYGITAQENAGSGLLKSTINIAGVPLGSGTWYAICK